MPSDDFGPAVRHQVADFMRATMVENALHHKGEEPFQAIDPFSAGVLESHGLLAVTGDARLPDELVAILAATDAPSRMPAPPGPLVFTEDGDQRSVVDPADLLARPIADHRLAALRYFAGLPDGVLARRTLRQIEDAKSRIASDDRAEWFPAAKGVYDLLRADVYLTLAGFRQCYSLRYVHGVDQFLPRLLRPDATLLSSVDLDCWNPTEDFESVRAAVRRLTEAKSLADALTGYYRQFGHLPLSGPVGIGEVLRGWAASHSDEGLWESVWAWADERQSPVARYHACAAFLSNPQRHLPAGVEGFFWGEVGAIVNAYPEGAANARWAEAWAIRDELAEHFGNFLECLLPGLPSERLMVMAWWMTERICELLPPSPGLLKKIRETAVAGELRRSGFMNRLTHPPAGPSSLRYMTRIMRRVWSASILCELGEGSWLLERKPPPDDVSRGIDLSLVDLFVLGYPRPVTAAPRPVYAFERALSPTATAWTKVAASEEGDRDQVNLAEALRFADQLSAPNSLPQLVGRLADDSPDNDVGAANILRQVAHFDPEAGNTLWTLLNANGLWRAVFLKVEADALDVLFDALTELQVQHGDPWRTNLSHMIAVAGIDSADPERRRLLFGATLFASIHAGSVSAIDRLMHGPYRAEFATLALKWRDHLTPALQALTPWAAGRVRAVLPSLALDQLDDPAGL